MSGYPVAIRECLIQAEMGNIEAALQRCLQEIAQTPEDGWAHDALGLIHCASLLKGGADKGALRSATAAFLQASQSANVAPLFLIHLAAVFDVQRQPQEALKVMRSAVEVLGALAELQAYLALYLAKCFHAEEARHIFTALLQQYPTNPDVWECYARGMQAVGLLDDAIIAFKGALTYNSKLYALLGMNYSNLLVAVGRRAEATAVKKNYLAAFGTPATARDERLAELRASNDRLGADLLWHEYVDSQGRSPQALFDYARYLFLSSRWPAAKELLDEIKRGPGAAAFEARANALHHAGTVSLPRIEQLAAQPPGRKRTPGEDVIVIRGVVDTATVNVIKQYRAITANAFVILSTWADTDKSYLAQLDGYVDDVLLNQRPATPGINHINYQLACAVAGVQRAKALGAKRVMVTRTDIALSAPALLHDLAKLIDADQPDASRCPGLTKRLVVCETFTQIVPLYHASDIFCYGTIDDVVKYWAFDSGPPTCMGPELFLCRKFAERVGRPLANTIEDSLAVIRDLFIVRSSESLQLYWQKYPDWPNPQILSERCVVTEDMWRGATKPLIKLSADLMPSIEASLNYTGH